jgi:hypothetical protein
VSISFIALSEADPVAVRELLVRQVWHRDWSEELAQSYFAWRYIDRGNGETLVAYDRGRCVGLIDSFLRPYWIAGQKQIVRETCDWFCLPEYRPLGVGLHLMRRMMAKPEPIIVVGGTDYTRDLLPRLKWAKLPDVDNFVLPVSAGTVAGLFTQSVWQRGAGLARLIPDIPLTVRLSRLAPPSPTAKMRVRMPGDTGEVTETPPYSFAPVIETKVLDWLGRAPALLGEFVVLSFFCDGEPAGVSISRLEKLSFGCVAQIVHSHPARFEMIDWMVSETVHHLIQRGAGAIFCRASCPTTGNALSSLGFHRRKPIPVSWWPATELPSAGALNLTSLQADDAFHFR